MRLDVSAAILPLAAIGLLLYTRCNFPKEDPMRILITNDDGINAPGLTILEAIAKTLAGPKGEVWLVAPALTNPVLATV
jgi:hypothetical protein